MAEKRIIPAGFAGRINIDAVVSIKKLGWSRLLTDDVQ